MAVPRFHFVLTLFAAVFLSASCRGFRLLPQSANAHEARLSKDGLKIAVRVTKTGFCLGYLAVFHGDEGEKPQERCTTAEKRAGATNGEPNLDSLTQFLAEARKRNAKVHVTIRSEAGVSPAAIQRVMNVVKTGGAKDTKDALNDFVISESTDGL